MRQIINRILKIISSAIFIILVLIMGLIIFYIVRVNFLADNDKLGEVRINMYTILTQSMYPTIKAGDVIVTYKDDNNQYNKGDVITFISPKNGGITITHRINNVYKVNNQYSYKTKGDNNNTADSEVVVGNNVLGKVVLKIPKVGFFQQFLVTKTGWIAVVVIPALGVIIYDILKVILMVTGIRTGNALTRELNDKNNERVNKARKELEEVFEDEKN